MLLLITNRNWHTPCQIRWKSLTSDDIESHWQLVDLESVILATAGLYVLTWFWRLETSSIYRVEVLAFPLTWHIAYTTACCYRTNHDESLFVKADSRQLTGDTAISRPKSYFFSRVRDMEHSTPLIFFWGGARTATDFDVWSSFERNFRPTRNPLIQ